jgi:hypothetical protein
MQRKHPELLAVAWLLAGQLVLAGVAGVQLLVGPA